MCAVRRLVFGLFAALASAGAQAEELPLAQKLTLLAAAYPETIAQVTPTHLVLADGTTLVIDDGHAKSHQQKLASADIEDMLSQIYPVGACDTGAPPARNHDPGRIRSETLMKAIYGATARAASTHLTRVPWFGTTVRFTNRAGAANALTAVANDLARAGPEARRFLDATGGTFNWRVIAGTDRLSVHAFGAAIDLNPKLTTYWRWAGGTPGHVPNYQDEVPREIVEAFERNGFIWGGKWYHFDTMHFEYRPELIAIGRLAEALGCP